MKYYRILLIFFSGIIFLSQSLEGDKKMTILKQLDTPVFWAEGHPGKLNRETWKIEVTGLCDSPQVFTWEDLQRMPKSIADARLTSVTRWSVRGKWGGVKLSDILQRVHAKPSVRYVRFWSVGFDYDTSIPIDIAEKERTLLAYDIDGVFLEEDYGGPVRVFCPYLWGYKSAKSIVKIVLMDHYEPGFWEIRGYSDSGEITAGKIIDVNDEKKIKKIPDGEVIEFLD